MRYIIISLFIIPGSLQSYSQDPTGIAKSFAEVLLDSARYFEMKDPERCLNFTKRILHEVPLYGNEKKHVNAFLLAANSQKMLDRKQDALLSCSKAIALSQQIPHRGLLHRSYYLKGTVFVQYEAKDSMIIYMQKVIETYNPDDDPYYVTNAYVNIGQLYIQLDNYQKGEEYMLKGYALAGKNKYAKMFALVPLVSFYYHFDNPKYLPYLDTLAQSEFYQKSSSNATMNHFDAFLMLDNVEGAKKEKTLRDVYAYSVMHSPLVNQVNFGMKLANYLNEIKRHDEAYQLLLELNHSAWESQSDYLIQSITQKLYETCKSMGALDKALFYLERYSDLRDSINSAENRKQIAELNIQFEAGQKDYEIEYQKALLEKEITEQRRFVGFLISGIIFLLLTSFLFFQFFRQRKLKQKAIERADTIHKMTELELQSLRAQLNPHFMFNSLNAIQELILMEENDKSHTYLARFAKLLRMLLENANSPFIPLAREIEFLQLYLSLENLRIPDLKYNIEIDPGINTEQIKIPNMILQPYIENAIWHGLSHKPTGDRKILIRVKQDSMGVNYEIEDNGIGRQRAAELKSQFRKEHKSRGMELLTKRFKLLGEEYRHQIETNVTDITVNNEPSGTRVAILIPWRMAQEEKKTA